jgi:hypothetical protein
MKFFPVDDPAGDSLLCEGVRKLVREIFSEGVNSSGR